MKKNYCISYTGLFESGYLEIAWFKKSGIRKYAPNENMKQRAAKFKFKWFANLICRLANKSSEVNYDFRTFQVIEL